MFRANCSSSDLLYQKCQSTQSTRSRQPYSAMETPLPLKVTTCTMWSSRKPTSLMSTVCTTDLECWCHWPEVVWRLCVRAYQWRCQPLGPCEEREQQDVPVWEQEDTVKLRDNTVDLNETKDLFARLMVLARSNWDINQKEAMGNYEFTLTPRALFACDGTILPCHDKSKLIHLLEKLTKEDMPHEDHQPPQVGSSTHQDAMDTGLTDLTSTDQPGWKMVLVDGMVLVQKLSKKTATVFTVKDLSGCFNDRLMQLTQDYDEIILVFDTYRADSLKSATRDKWRQGKASIQYQVRDHTNIKHIPMSRFLSHDKTKSDLTEYFDAKTLEYNKGSSKLIITSASGLTKSNKDLWRKQPRRSRHTADPPGCPGFTAKPTWYTVDVFLTRYKCFSASYSKLWSHVEEHVHFYGLWCCADWTTVASSR